MKQEDFLNVINNYYRSGTPAKAVAALEYLLSSGWVDEDEPGRGVLTSYIFRRIAESVPEIREKAWTLFDHCSPAWRRFVVSLLLDAGDEKSQALLARVRRQEPHLVGTSEKNLSTGLNAMRRTIESPLELDLLWGEFLVTGSHQPVRRIIHVLEWPDRIREHLDQWLQVQPINLLGRWQRSRTLARLEELGIPCHADACRVDTLEDLDCFSALQDLEIVPERFKQVEGLLPFALDPADLIHIAIKSAAAWSLGSQARQHPIVLATCEQEAKRRPGRAKIMLLEIVARAYQMAAESPEQFTGACQMISEYHAALANGSEKAWRELENLAQLQEDPTNGGFRSLPDPAQAAADCSRKLARVRSYASRLTIRNLARSDLESRGHRQIEWRFHLVEPGDCHVNQIAWDTELGEVFDEWISVGRKHYRNTGFWVDLSSANPGRQDRWINRFLRAGKFCELLRASRPVAGYSWDKGPSRFLLLSFRSTSMVKLSCTPLGRLRRWGSHLLVCLATALAGGVLLMVHAAAALAHTLAFFFIFSPSPTVDRLQKRASDGVRSWMPPWLGQTTGFYDYLGGWFGVRSSLCKGWVWIDPVSHLPMKGLLHVQGHTRRGERIDMTFEQVFTEWNERRCILPPRILGMGSGLEMELYHNPIE